MTYAEKDRFVIFCQFYEEQFVKDYLRMNKFYLREHPLGVLQYFLPIFLGFMLWYLRYQQLVSAYAGVDMEEVRRLKSFKENMQYYREDCVFIFIFVLLLMFIFYALRHYRPISLARKAYREMATYRIVMDDLGMTKIAERGRGGYEYFHFDWAEIQHLWVYRQRIYVITDNGERIVIHTPALEKGSTGDEFQLRKYALEKFEKTH